MLKLYLLSDHVDAVIATGIELVAEPEKHQHMAFEFDHLNRVKSSDAFSHVTSTDRCDFVDHNETGVLDAGFSVSLD
jgi:hypothetical protein